MNTRHTLLGHYPYIEKIFTSISIPQIEECEKISGLGLGTRMTGNVPTDKQIGIWIKAIGVKLALIKGVTIVLIKNKL